MEVYPSTLQVEERFVKCGIVLYALDESRHIEFAAHNDFFQCDYLLFKIYGRILCVWQYSTDEYAKTGSMVQPHLANIIL